MDNRVEEAVPWLDIMRGLGGYHCNGDDEDEDAGGSNNDNDNDNNCNELSHSVEGVRGVDNMEQSAKLVTTINEKKHNNQQKQRNNNGGHTGCLGGRGKW